MTAYRPSHKMTFQELDALNRRIRSAYRVLVKDDIKPEFYDLRAVHWYFCVGASALRDFANAFRDFDNAVNIGGPIAAARREAQWCGEQVSKRIADGGIRLEPFPAAPPPPILPAPVAWAGNGTLPSTMPPAPVAGGRQQ